LTRLFVAIWRVLTGRLENPGLSGISLPLSTNAISHSRLNVPAMKETVQRKRGGKAFQSVLTPHFDFIREQRQRRKAWREIADSLAAEKDIRVCLHTVYYFYKRRLKHLASPHWEDAAVSGAGRQPATAPAPSQKPILAATPPQREFRRPNAQAIKLNDPTKV
jgi:hypothetical protein